jgi:16S rRNA (guanine966-N2)-methyltransferase
MRVIAGSARGVPLRAPAGHRTRPTPDRVREALFSRIAADVPGAVVLDLFAGSGALGIEALSRGAQYAVLVDRDRRAVRVIEANLAAARVRARARVVQGDAHKLVASPALLAGHPYGDLVFCDPPYAEPLTRVTGLLERLHRAGLLAADALIVLERDRRDPDLHRAVPEFLDHLDDHTYGEVQLRLLRTRSGRQSDVDGGVGGPPREDGW